MSSPVGQPFYIMDHVPGRIFSDRLLPSCASEDRGAMYDAMNQVLARLHDVDYRAVGLGDFGRPENYVARQVSRWGKQYRSSPEDGLPAMDRMIAWLEENIPSGDPAGIVHGDYRLGNIVFHPTEPYIVAVLDWELETMAIRSPTWLITAFPGGFQLPRAEAFPMLISDYLVSRTKKAMSPIMRGGGALARSRIGSIFWSLRCFAARRSWAASMRGRGLATPLTHARSKSGRSMRTSSLAAGH